MGVWSEHGTSWYNCSRFEEKPDKGNGDAQSKSRASLERYLHVRDSDLPFSSSPYLDLAGYSSMLSSSMIRNTRADPFSLVLQPFREPRAVHQA